MQIFRLRRSLLSQNIDINCIWVYIKIVRISSASIGLYPTEVPTQDTGRLGGLGKGVVRIPCPYFWYHPWQRWRLTNESTWRVSIKWSWLNLSIMRREEVHNGLLIYLNTKIPHIHSHQIPESCPITLINVYNIPSIVILIMIQNCI